MAKVIKLTDNSNNTLLPITDASYIQMKVGDDVRSVKDIIIENEEITALALNDLHSSKQEKLISGVTIKTINDESLIGSGDISLPEVYDVRFIATSSSTWTCNHSYSDIVTAFNEGKLIVGMVGQSASSSFSIDGINITLGPLGLNMQDAPDYCFLTAVRNYISGGDHVLFSMIYEDQLGIHGRIILTIRLDSSDNITVHAEPIGGSGQASAIAGGATNQIAYQTAANTTGFITAPTINGTFLKYDDRSGGFGWAADNDSNVAVTSTTKSGSYPILFKNTANNVQETKSIRFDSDGTTCSYYNPASNTMYTKYSYTTEFTEGGKKLTDKYHPKGWTTVLSCTTSGATKTVTASGFTLNTGAIISVRFTQNVPANSTLNINSTGAKSIYYNNAAITANIIFANDTATFVYNGTNYVLISIDTCDRVYATSTTDVKYCLIGVTESSGSSSRQNPYFNEGIYINANNELQATTFNENGTTLANKYAPISKYTVKAVSSNAVSFTTSSKMLPNTVYACGSVNNNMFTFGLVNSLSIANNSLDSDVGIIWNTRQASITNNMIVPTYQIVFRCGSNGASITLPGNVVWRDGSAPAASDLVNKWCELTIMNDIATIIII